MKDSNYKGIAMAAAAAALYALNIPLSKLLLAAVPPAMLAALLYLGAGAGMGVMRLFKVGKGEKLTRKDAPFVVMMVMLDIAAPVLLMLGLGRTAAANAALLQNFEIVATAVVAAAFFKERVSGRLWCAIGLVTAASILISVSGEGALRFSGGSLLIMGACACWGLENNCTKAISDKDASQIVLVKGIFSGLGSLIVAFIAGERFGFPLYYAALALALGFVAYGLSIYFYVHAQNLIGAARTSACYAAAPFVGALLSLVLFRELPCGTFLPALLIMAAGAWLVARDGADKRQ